MLPNFLGIGAQRAGTTWVYNCLREHPQVYMASSKELHFFSYNFDKGLCWYESQFQSRNNETAVGEITPNYLNVVNAIPRIAECIPDARLLVILREPLDRARSAYRLLKAAKYDGIAFADACKVNSYLAHLSLYSSQMERVFRYFDRAKVMVALYDDVQATPKGFLGELFRFIGVDDSFEPPSAKERYNQVLYPRLQSVIERVGLGPSLEVFKRTSIGKLTKRIHSTSVATSRGVNESYEVSACLRNKFREDLLKLQDIIDRDLSAWIRVNE